MIKSVKKRVPYADGVDILSKKKWIVEGIKFMEGDFFPAFLGAVAFLFYALNLPILGLTVFLACTSFICLFCKDTRPGVAIALLILLTFRFKDNPGAYLTWYSVIVYSIFGPFVAFSIIYRLMRHRVEWQRKEGLLSVALLCVAFLIGGVFNEYYNFRNFGYVIAMVAPLFCCYAFFAFTMEKREDNLRYLARVCVVFLCVASLQVLELYLRLYTWGTPLDAAWKGKITLGWSISNMVAEMMVVLLPAVFYLICTERKGYWYWSVIVLAVFAIFFTLARNALLWAAFTAFLGLIATCIFGVNKTFNRWLILILAAAAVLLLLLLIVTGVLTHLPAFFEQVKFGDRGRLKIWERHLSFFIESPLNGVGFEAYRTLMPGSISKAHNNLIQMLSSTGIVGLALYIVHRVQTIYLIAQNPSEERLLIGGSIIVTIGLSMLSSTFFMPYFMVYYGMILLFLEKSLGERDGEFFALLKKKKK